jgi:hypothetical protein
MSRTAGRMEGRKLSGNNNRIREERKRKKIIDVRGKKRVDGVFE